MPDMNPLIYLFIEIALTVFIIGFTAPFSALRPVGLLIITLCVIRCIPNCMPYMIRTPWAALVGGYSITYLYHYLDIALLSRWSFKHRAPVSGLLRPAANSVRSRETLQLQGSGSSWDKFAFGLNLASTFRFIGTEYEVRNAPRATVSDSRDFRRRTLLTILFSYCVLDFINSNNDLSISTRYLTPEKIPLLSRLHQVTAEELTIRLFTVLVSCIGLICVQGGVYHIFALVAVRAKVTQPSAWPPFYGSAREAYTLRQFWDIFWHQTNTRKFSSIAHYTTHVLIGLPRGTVIARYFRIVVAFMCSGFMHLLDDRAAGISVSDSGAMRFFLTQGLGLILEDCVLKLYGRCPSCMQISRGTARIIGFAWVLVFLTWSVPVYMYPMLWRANQGLQDSTIPFSLFGPRAEMVKALGFLSLVSTLALTG
ncbi:membrane bound O-acyl transferase family-domain-containing protein [Phaeosphaeria sp. MPI-PUGE-AT-0046c]|nr:membrane bound O-acyl transferase family-domain-containing protein [Phaeosphaeria sp. MPI-PUGE-AT-0046c]